MAQGPPNLASTVNRFSMPATRRRYGPPVQTAEKLLADSPPTETPIRLHHWPAPGVTEELRGEGKEPTNRREATTTADVRGTVQGSPDRADSIVIGSSEYEVVSTAPRHVGANGVVTSRSLVMVEVLPRAWP